MGSSKRLTFHLFFHKSSTSLESIDCLVGNEILFSNKNLFRAKFPFMLRENFLQMAAARKTFNAIICLLKKWQKKNYLSRFLFRCLGIFTLTKGRAIQIIIDKPHFCKVSEVEIKNDCYSRLAKLSLEIGR